MSEILLVRHGQTEWSRTGRHTGRTDVPLTPLGRRQAGAIGRMLGDDLGTVLVSPLLRARETAELAGFAERLVELAALAEWDYGEYEGRTTTEVRDSIPDWSVWTHPIRGGESLGDLATRADHVIDRLLSTNGRVAVFSHGHFLRVLAARWAGLPAVAARHLALATATVSRLGWERETRVIVQWNEMCHLREKDTAG